MITARSLKSGVLIQRASENGSKRSKLPRGSVTLFSPLSRSASADASLDQLGVLRRLAGLLGIGPVGDLAALDRLEREVADQPGHDRLATALRRLEPGLERRPALLGQPVELGLGGLDLRLDRRDGSILVGARSSRSVGVGTASVKCEYSPDSSMLLKKLKS